MSSLSDLSADLFMPWLVAGALVVPLIYMERWIHKHLQGLGLLISNDRETAVILYYFIMLPGVLVHEFGHWIIAKVLLVKVKKVRLWPERKKGSLRLGLVETVQTDPVRSSLIGMGPVVAGVVVVYLISTKIMNSQAFYESLATGDLPTIFSGIQTLTSTPDFWVWTYFLFAVSNAMMPSPSDRQSWPIVGAGIAAVAVVMFILDLGTLVILGLQQLALAAQALTVAFLTAIGVDAVFIVVIYLLEEILGRAFNRVINYK
jgi:hypothetical protein